MERAGNGCRHFCQEFAAHACLYLDAAMLCFCLSMLYNLCFRLLACEFIMLACVNFLDCSVYTRQLRIFPRHIPPPDIFPSHTIFYADAASGTGPL